LPPLAPPPGRRLHRSLRQLFAERWIGREVRDFLPRDLRAAAFERWPCTRRSATRRHAVRPHFAAAGRDPGELRERVRAASFAQAVATSTANDDRHRRTMPQGRRCLRAKATCARRRRDRRRDRSRVSPRDTGSLVSTMPDRHHARGRNAGLSPLHRDRLVATGRRHRHRHGHELQRCRRLELRRRVLFDDSLPVMQSGATRAPMSALGARRAVC
jgi:hypothetical protein